MVRPPETYSTARLTARPVTVADAPAIFAAYANDPVVTRYLAWKAYTEIGPLAEFLATREENWRTGKGHFAWLLQLKETGEVAGSLGVEFHGHGAVFGYVIARAFWGRGLMAEALAHVVDWSLSQPEIYRAWAFCDVENPASARVMEKAGMQREGMLRRWHVCPTIGPEPRDCIACAKVR